MCFDSTGSARWSRSKATGSKADGGILNQRFGIGHMPATEGEASHQTLLQSFRLSRFGLALAASVLALGSSGAARAQSLPDYVPRGTIDPVLTAYCTANPNDISKCEVIGLSAISSEDAVVLNKPTTVTDSNTVYSTQVIGRIVGGTPLYDQTFAAPFASPSVQAGLTAARAAITAAGGPGVIIGAPVLTASQTTTVSTTNSVYSLAGTSTDVTDETTLSPGATVIGTRVTCNVVSALQSNTAPTCTTASPTAIFDTGKAKPGQEGTINYTNQAGTATNIDTTTVRVVVNPVTSSALALVNSILVTTYTIDETTTTTNTTTVFEQYTLNGIVQAIGGEQASAVSALGDENRRFNEALLSRIISGGGLGGIVPAGGGTPGRGWAEGFGWTGKAAGDSRSGAGLDGGMNVDLSENLRAGFGVSHGWVNVSLTDGSGSAAVNLTELGVAARYFDQGFYAAATGVAGFGNAAANGLASSQNFSVSLLSTSGELGYAIPSGDVAVTPNLGGAWSQINTGSFTGSGSSALVSSGSTNGFGKAWAGLKVNGAHDQLSFAGYARLAAYSSENITVPVSFLGSSAVLPISGQERSALGLEAGLSADISLASNLDAFAAYDLRLRGDTAIHAGTVGLALRW